MLSRKEVFVFLLLTLPFLGIEVSPLTGSWAVSIGVWAVWALLVVGYLFWRRPSWPAFGTPRVSFGPSDAPDTLLDERLYSDDKVVLSPRAQNERIPLLVRLDVGRDFPVQGVLRFVERSGPWWNRRWPYVSQEIAGVRSALGPDTGEQPDPEWSVRGATGRNFIPIRIAKLREPRKRQPVWIRAEVYANRKGRFFLEFDGKLKGDRSFRARRPVDVMEP